MKRTVTRQVDDADDPVFDRAGPPEAAQVSPNIRADIGSKVFSTAGLRICAVDQKDAHVHGGDSVGEAWKSHERGCKLSLTD
jgi:hypothetical protein